MVEECISHPDPECILELFDLDGDFDGLNYDEAEEAFYVFFPDAVDWEFEEAFDELDQNEDGLISAEELAVVLEEH